MNNNPRKFYNTFTPFLNSKTKDNSAISLNILGVKQQDQGLVAREFTNYFCSIADHIGGQYACIISELHRSVLAINAKHTPNTFKFRKLKRQEVLAALKERVPRVLKIAAEQLATPLTTIFNQAIENNHWPNTRENQRPFGLSRVSQKEIKIYFTK